MKIIKTQFVVVDSFKKLLLANYEPIMGTCGKILIIL